MVKLLDETVRVLKTGGIAIFETQLSRAEVKLKPGLNRYEVILDFPSGEDPQIDIFYEKSGSPASLGMSADSRNLSVLWSEIAFRIIDK